MRAKSRGLPRLTLLAVAAVVAIAAVAGVLRSGGDGDSASTRVGPRAQGDLTCRPTGRPRATLLLFHPGGFATGTARDFSKECQLFARHGYLAVSVDYSHTLARGVRDAESRARKLAAAAHHHQRPVFAYGISAGGTFAATLAARDEVDAAFAFAGVYDIAKWADGNKAFIRSIGATPAQLVRLSPVNLPLRRPAPLLIVHNQHDIVAPYDAAFRMARRSGRFTLHTLRRPVNGYAAHIPHPIAPALAFFKLHRRAP